MNRIKKYFAEKPKKEIATLIVVIVILLFDAFMIYKFAYYKSLPLNGESTMDLSGQSSYDGMQYQDEINLFSGEEEAEFDLETE